jgi:hypothetical protein
VVICDIKETGGKEKKALWHGGVTYPVRGKSNAFMVT